MGNTVLGTIRNDAVQILLYEVFGHVAQERTAAYKRIAMLNSQVLGVKSDMFVYDGTVYPLPEHSLMGEQIVINKVMQRTSQLDPSLLPDLFEANALLENAGFDTIRNLFSTIMNHCYNNIVLSEFIPTVLLNNLRAKFRTNFEGASAFSILDKGALPNEMVPETVDETKKNIDYIYKYYSEDIQTFKDIMVDKLLLQE